MIAGVLAALSWGQVYVPVESMLAVISGQFGAGFFSATPVTPEQTAVIWNIRLPRTIVGLLVGAALAVSGAVMQGVFSNPLAEPGIIGISAGASFGAVIAIALGLTASSMLFMPLFALAGALLAMAMTVFLVAGGGRIPAMVLLLSGVAINMMLGAVTSAILTFMNEHRLREYLFWLVGGLDYRRWEHVYLAVGPIVIGIIVLFFLSRHLDILVLGDDEARAVGMPVALFRFVLLFAAALTTATAVCVSGNVGFVGLVVPHIMRLLIGPGHRLLLPVSALTGGVFLVFCDTVGRVLLSPVEIRVGIVTALVGAPYFLYLLRRARNGRELI